MPDIPHNLLSFVAWLVIAAVCAVAAKISGE